MLSKLTATLLCAVGLASPTLAQERSLNTVQTCGPVEALTELAMNKYSEKPLFSSSGVQIHPNGNAYRSEMMYFVNQDTGTWSLVSLYPDGTACLVANGSDFRPYAE